MDNKNTMTDKTLIFDFSGTIADTKERLYNLVLPFVKNHDRNSFAYSKLIRTQELDMQGLKNIVDIPIWKVLIGTQFIKYKLHQNLDELHLFDGIADTLIELKMRGFHLSIVSSDSKDFIIDFLKYNDIELFDKIYGNIINKKKVLKNMLNNGDVIGEAIYIGDEPRDIKAAHHCGMKVAAVSWGFCGEALLRRYGPEYLLKHPEQLLNL
jgi:phosphoglycolate phosphatase